MYEDHTPLKPSREKIHDYLAMELDYTEKGKLKINMIIYIQEVIENFKYKEELGAEMLLHQLPIISFKLMKTVRNLMQKEQISFTQQLQNVYLCVKEVDQTFRLLLHFYVLEYVILMRMTGKS